MLSSLKEQTGFTVIVNVYYEVRGVAAFKVAITVTE